MGIALIYTTYNVQQFVVEYSKCSELASTDFQDISSKYVTKHFQSYNSDDYNTPQWRLVESDDTTTCQIKFSIPHEIKAPVYLYYKLTKFYQNHREYVESYDLQQLKGEAVSADDLDSDCGPLKTNSDGKPYYPCGLIANSMFNDTFDSPYKSDDETSIYNMTDKAISWSSDRSRYQKTKYKASEIVPPPNWKKMYPDGYTDDNIPDISKWSEFQNWMQIPGLSTFSKLVLRNDDDVLKAGTYEVEIGMNWPVKEFNGKKSIYLTTRSVIGGRNPFLGIAWIVAGGICLILSIVFLIINLVVPRKMGDVSLLSWNQQPVKLEGDN